MTYTGSPPIMSPFTSFTSSQFAVNVPPPSPPIYSKSNELMEQTEHLAKTIEELGQRLSGIMGPEGPTACTASVGTLDKPKSDHLARLEDISSRLHGSISRIRGIMSRLEV